MKKLFVLLFTAAIMLSIVPSVNAETADSDSVITQDGDFVPLYTVAPDNSLKDHSNVMTDEQSILFYTQTTLLALVAGYLILFKVRCIPKGEKMHRRKLNKTDL